MKALFFIDYLIFGLYFLIVIGIALWVSRKPKDHDRSPEDYFLAGRSLPWWIIGASLIASNISTEQIIGMNGTAFESGIAVISYSWIGACLSILIVAKFFLPAFLKLKIYSMPEFLEKRYDRRVSASMGVFWILVFVFVNLTSILSLGAITLGSILDLPINYSIIGLAIVSAIYTVYGGLSAVAWTDFIQVGILIIGGIIVVVLGLNKVGDSQGIITGFQTLLENQADRFHTVLPASHQELPWTGVFFGGLWLAALSYWGCNQYIIQRALAAKDLDAAKHGLLFAAFLSLIVSVIIVLPGIIAKDLYQGEITSRDQAFPFLVKELLPAGYVGLVIASLIAAIISSLNSMCNSVATIFTMDIYKKSIRPNASDSHLIFVGRITTITALLIATLVAPTITRMGRLFAFIQEYSGFIWPGVFCIFFLGLIWKRANANGALTAIFLTIPISLLLKVIVPDIAFLNRMMITFIMLVIFMISVSLNTSPSQKEITFDISHFPLRSSLVFNVGALLISGVVGVLYLIFI